MPRIILTSRYLKAAPKSHVANLVEYIATRDGVDKTINGNDIRPATEKQQQTIQQLLETAPHMKKSLEYEDYTQNPTMGNASELISETISQNLDLFAEKENFVEYMAKRPGAERLGEHGLWNGGDEPIDLKMVQQEAANHKGRLWTHVVSLRREDAERLGFNNAEAWKSVVQGQASTIAESMKIPVTDLRWYAAFHNESHHPHIHMMVYSNNPKHGYLTEKGIEKMRSGFANEIFKQDLVQLYQDKTEARDMLIAAARERINALVDDMSHNLKINPQLENMIAELAGRLSVQKGKKTYGYLKADDKRIVDEIVRELAVEERIGVLYKEWCGLQDEILGTYRDKLSEHPPLWEQKEFKPIKNAVIKEAASLFESRIFIDIPDVPEPVEADPPELDMPDVDQSDDALVEWSAEYKLAQNYLYGRNQYEQDIPKALELFEAEAGRGNTLAMFEIGRIYQQEMLGAENTERAQEHFAQALNGFFSVESSAEKEWMQSYLRYRLGKMHHMGLGTEQDYHSAAHWYKSAGANKFALYSLGSLYYYGNGVEQNYTEALRLYEAAAELDNAYALYECGKMYGVGIGCEVDAKKSNRYYTKAFAAFEIMEKDQADDKLWYRLGQMCLKGLGTDIDADRAREYFEKSAAAGNEFAKYSLARLILNDANATPEETEMAVGYMTDAADSGNQYAQYSLGKLYLQGEKLPQDLTTAEKYLVMAADQGNEFAQYTLGKLYLDENTILYNLDEAARRLTESADQGNEFAQYRLGRFLYETDPAKAVDWLTASAEQGNQYAQYSLGKHYYYDGDMEHAVRLFLQSAAQGNEYAAKMLDFIENGGRHHANASAVNLLYHLSRMIQNQCEDNQRKLLGHAEKKLMRKIAQKKEAMGQKMN